MVQAKKDCICPCWQFGRKPALRLGKHNDKNASIRKKIIFGLLINEFGAQ